MSSEEHNNKTRVTQLLPHVFELLLQSFISCLPVKSLPTTLQLVCMSNKQHHATPTSKHGKRPCTLKQSTQHPLKIALMKCRRARGSCSSMCTYSLKRNRNQGAGQRRCLRFTNVLRAIYLKLERGPNKKAQQLITRGHIQGSSSLPWITCILPSNMARCEALAGAKYKGRLRFLRPRKHLGSDRSFYPASL